MGEEVKCLLFFFFLLMLMDSHKALSFYLQKKQKQNITLKPKKDPPNQKPSVNIIFK